MRTKTWFWVDLDEGIAVADSEQARNDTSNPICPKCGERSVFEEGQIDQDFMGNDINGWWFTCFGCGIATQATEGRWNDE